MTRTFKSYILLSSSILALGLSACQSTSATSTGMSNAEMLDSALMRAADQTTAKGMNAEGLKILETIYKRNPQDPQGAMRFARGLREMGETTKAAIVLEPFTKDINAPSSLKLEYSAIQLEAGRYESAERVARDAVKQNPISGLGYHLLGTALDAQGLHVESESAFRSALENWTGDPVPVMNNLALSLTAQEKLDEAAEILMQAKEADPSRLEIERNLRIVNALRETAAYEPSSGRGGKTIPLE